MKNSVRKIAWVLLTVMIIDVVSPMATYALTGGPGQPEVQGFSPIGNTDMVNLFSGDFSYNIPLLDVEGYPINLVYNAGITMDQEASWVGLGWSLTPGAVERNLRGIPDDFNGDQITRYMHLRPNRTVGGQLGLDFELWGLDNLGQLELNDNDEGNSASLNLSLGCNFNNYHGVSFSTGVGMTMKSMLPGKTCMNSGLGLNSSSQDGLRVQPNIGFDFPAISEKLKNSWSMGFGLSLSSRSGLQNVSFNSAIKLNGSKRMKPFRMKGFGSTFDLGSPTYSPQITMNMRNVSLSGSFKFGIDFGGVFTETTVSGYYSLQELMSTNEARPAYGFLHLHNGQHLPSAQLDFNREKDGPFSEDQTSLPIAQLTSDVFSASGQNVGGSYRAYRREVGHVFDPRSTNTGSGGTVGVEIGPGQPIHWGVDVLLNTVNSWSGDWTNSNVAGSLLRYRGGPAGGLGESAYFREANEPTIDLDPGLFNGLGGDKAVRPLLSGIGSYDMMVNPVLMDKFGMPYGVSPQNYRSQREPRNQIFTYLSHGDVMNDMGLDAVVGRPGSPIESNIPSHHMSEVTILSNDGSRNVYGIPAYNIEQKDIVFAIEPLPHAEGETHISYANDPTIKDNGHPTSRDQYASHEITPKYAHSFLLTAVLSSDYSDIDGFRGPSPNDLGSYTKFSYRLHDEDYHWRTPLYATTSGGNASAHTARLDRGDLGTDKDDKASVSCGRKEIWYLEKIESRNLIAVFTTEQREDGIGVTEDGALDMSDRMDLLRKIDLYERKDYLANGSNATPIKSVHFDYDYRLCKKLPNRSTAGQGKLTLTDLYFTYGNSHRGVTSPYKFHYADELNPQVNPDYDGDKQDRWGQYKEHGFLPNQSFPYTDQENADVSAYAWNLIQIELPSGGIIDIEYESDDYAYVQDKDAARMFQVVGISDTPYSAGSGSTPVQSDNIMGSDLYMRIRKPSDMINMPAAEYFTGIDELYFRYKVEMDAPSNQSNDKLGYDYISGYAKLSGSPTEFVDDQSEHFIEFRIASVPLDGDDPNNGPFTNPIRRAAMDFLRLHYPQEAYSPEGFSDQDPFGEQLITSMADATFGLLTSFADFFNGPNQELANESGNFCRTAIVPDGWVRLREADRSKHGGGHRVRSITSHDSWSSMGTSAPSASYTQTYSYLTEEGYSSGVAAYEPMIGADENPWRQPYYYSSKVKLSPDERFYQEEPFGESMFPGPSVGYSRVVVQDEIIDPIYQASQGTGFVVNEFYTAKDFPIILDRTGIDAQRKNSNFSLLSLLGVKKHDNNHTSQGFVVETNDMHGKPKSTTVYPQPQPGIPSQAVSYVRYEYSDAPYGSARRLANAATVISPNGNISTAQIGRHYEFVADMREFGSKNTSGGLALNSETLILIAVNLWIPIPIPKHSMESTRYRSATFVKKLHRFGLLTKITKMENGSVVSTENLAYDSHTGEVLLTKTHNDFKDPVYTLNFPAYWHYDGMGPAYRNIGASWNDLTVTSGQVTSLVNADMIFTEGDELLMTPAGGGTVVKGWINAVSPGDLEVINSIGQLMPTGVYDVRIVRSGRRNQMSTQMASITSLSDPLSGFGGNVFSNILQANVIELEDHWKVNCACLEDGTNLTTNPFRVNKKGVWRLNKEHAWLTERSRSIEDNNSNIRRDGIFTSFDPFYKLNSGEWVRDHSGWTMVREVTEYSERGQELENVDALDLYSSATFGYGGSLPKSIARNSKYADNGFEGFEEGDILPCTDKHFKFDVPLSMRTSQRAHTGRFSVKVPEGETILMNAPIAQPCPEGNLVPVVVALPDRSGSEACFSVSGMTPEVSMEIENVEGISSYELTEDGFCVSFEHGSFSGLVSFVHASGSKTRYEIQ